MTPLCPYLQALPRVWRGQRRMLAAGLASGTPDYFQVKYSTAPRSSKLQLNFLNEHISLTSGPSNTTESANHMPHHTRYVSQSFPPLVAQPWFEVNDPGWLKKTQFSGVHTVPTCRRVLLTVEGACSLPCSQRNREALPLEKSLISSNRDSTLG